MYNLIHDETELKYFFDNIVPDLKPTEVFFVSLSCRNKYLTDAEKKMFSLSRTEMIERRVIRLRDWNRFLRTIRKFETNFGSYKTKTNLDIPEKCIIIYWNINPSDTLKTYKEFSKTMLEYQYELSHCYTDERNVENIVTRINKMDHLMYTCYQKNRGVKHWIDLDFDVPKETRIPYKMNQWLKDQNLETFYWIETHGGFHLLVKPSELKFNPNEIVERGYNILKDYYVSLLVDDDAVSWVVLSGQVEKQHYLAEQHEIKQNENFMVPLPGTFQGGFPVRVLKDLDS